MLSFLWNLASFIVALGALITVHEFGHLRITRRYGVHIERFSTRFGKALWQRADKLGTEYVIVLIPLGDYIKMLGERAELVVPKLRHHAFNSKFVDQRAAAVATGPVVNFIFAIFAYWLVFIIGMPGVRPVVGEIAANSIAAEARVAPSMELKAVDDVETPDWDAVRLQSVDKTGGESTTITVVPFGSDQRQDVKLDLRRWAFEPDKEDSVPSLGIRPCGPRIEPVLESVQPDSAASKAGLQADDRIIRVDGQSLTQWATFVMLVRDNPGKSSVLETGRRGSPLSLTLIPESKPGKGKAIGFVGIESKVILLPDEYKAACQYGPSNTVVEATDRMRRLVKLAVSVLGKLTTGDVKLSNLSGPISIAKGTGTTAELGIVYYLLFLAFISVNLGIINLFPLPILNGGYLLFLAIEKIKDGPIPERA